MKYFPLHDDILVWRADVPLMIVIVITEIGAVGKSVVVFGHLC